MHPLSGQLLSGRRMVSGFLRYRKREILLTPIVIGLSNTKVKAKFKDVYEYPACLILLIHILVTLILLK